MTFSGGGDGQVSFVVWPTHAGCVNEAGDEPMFGIDYQRGQITWEVGEDRVIRGRTRIQVPAGKWCWVIYCHNPLYPGYITAKKLAHPLVLAEPGFIDLHEITEDEVKPLAPDPVLRD